MEIDLPGLDGRKLLAFLASLGTHVALAHKLANVRMRWNAASYRPTILVPDPDSSIQDSEDPNSSLTAKRDYLIGQLECALQELGTINSGHRFPPDWNNLKVARMDFRDKVLRPCAEKVRKDKTQRIWADFASGLGSDASGSHKELYTALCVITGDSHQHFLGFMRDLSTSWRKGRNVYQVTGEHLKKTLFEQWKYDDHGRSFRWDPVEDRRYALRASDPSKGPDKEVPSMWGANRLAFEALACFPCFPRGWSLRTTAFDDDEAIHWPLWTPALSLETVKSLLAHPAILDSDRRVLRALGVFAVASARRISVERKRSFGPASLRPIEGN